MASNGVPEIPIGPCKAIRPADNTGVRSPLSYVRSGVRLSSGTIVMLEAGAPALQFVDHRDSRLSTRSAPFGVEQYPSQAMVRFRHDSSLIVGVTPSHIDVVDSTGHRGRVISIHLPHVMESYSVAGAMSAGAIVVVGRPRRRDQGDWFGRDTLELLVFDATGRRVSARALSDATRASRRRDARSRTERGTAVSRADTPVAPGPVTRTATVAVAGRRVFHFDEERDALAVYDDALREVSEALLPALPAPLRPRIDHVTAEASAQRLEVLGDAAGRAWVEMPRPTIDDQRVWWIFDQNAVLLGTSRTPPGGRVLDVGAGYVLLAHRTSGGTSSNDELLECELHSSTVH